MRSPAQETLIPRLDALVALIVGVALWRWVGARKLVPFVLALVVVVAPWMIRNQVQVGTPRLTTSEGFNLTPFYSPGARRSRASSIPCSATSSPAATCAWAATT